MAESKKHSLLVQSVLTFDTNLAEFERLGAKIASSDLKSEFDFEQSQRLMQRFSELGETVSADVAALSNHLSEARERAEASAARVAARAHELKDRKSDQQKKVEEFQSLAERVRGLNRIISELKPVSGGLLSPEARDEISVKLSSVQGQLAPLIAEAQNIRTEARKSKMKSIEQNAESMAQTLLVVREKLDLLTSKN